MAKKTFLQGAIILGAAALIIKLMGAFFRIPLANMIGDQGMGYYGMAYPIYVFLLVFSTSGIPTAISKMVSERIAFGNHAGAHRVFKVSFMLLLVLGVATSAILFFGASFIAQLIKSPGSYYSFKAIAPALLFAPIMAAFRGYFQGMQDMKPTATSQIVEQLFRVILGLGLAYYLLSKGLVYAAAGASAGATAGTVGGILAILLIYAVRRKRILSNCLQARTFSRESSRDILYKIVVIAVPITIGAAIMPVMGAIDVFIVMGRLQACGFTEDAATKLYGQLSGMAAPLIGFPQALTTGIAMSLVPTIAAANQNRDMQFLRYNVSLGMRMAMIISLPCAVGMMILAEPIMLLLYPLQKASAVNAASCLVILSVGVVLLAAIQTLTGTLQGMGKQKIPVRNLLIGAGFKVVCTFTLVGISDINVKGAAAGTVLAYAVAAVLNLYAVKKYTGTRFDLRQTVLKPFISVSGMGICVYVVYYMSSGALGNSLATVLSILIGVIVYIVAILATKSISEEELAILPKGIKLQNALKKLRKKI